MVEFIRVIKRLEEIVDAIDFLIVVISFNVIVTGANCHDDLIMLASWDYGVDVCLNLVNVLWIWYWFDEIYMMLTFLMSPDN